MPTGRGCFQSYNRHSPSSMIKKKDGQDGARSYLFVPSSTVEHASDATAGG